MVKPIAQCICGLSASESPKKPAAHYPKTHWIVNNRACSISLLSQNTKTAHQTHWIEALLTL